MAAPKRVARLRGTMQEAVEQAVDSMKWLQPSDLAVVALAIKYASEIDKAGDDQRAIGYLGQQLMGALRSLGGMPAERKALGVEDKVGSRLDRLRAARVERFGGAENLDATEAGPDT